ncbi:methylmalonyl-CoA epimerase [Chloroflexota bacterium]
MATKIDHIGIAVSNVEETLKLYCDVLGLKPEDIERETVEEQKVKAAMIPVGESRFELMESTDPEGVIAKFIEKRGEGIHHIAVGVNNIKEELEALKANGIPLIDSEPRTGVGGAKIAFLHPRATKILLELVEGGH